MTESDNTITFTREEWVRLQEQLNDYHRENMRGLLEEMTQKMIDAQVVPEPVNWRAHYAGLAMQGFVSHITGPAQQSGESNSQAHARAAVMYADALLAELTKET